jgi:glycosyltransferase involved in cell wall biosynthesis
MFDIAIIQTPHSQLNLLMPAGMERVELEELKRLARLGHRTKLYANNVTGTKENIVQIAGYKKVGIVRDYLFSLKSLYRSREADFIIAYYLPRMALLAPQRTYVYFQGDAIMNLPLKRFGWALERYRKARYIFCSDHIRRVFEGKHPEIDRSRLSVLHNGVDTDHFKPKERSGSDKVRFSYHGRWVEKKGILVLLEAVGMLERTRDDFECHIAGGADVPFATADSILADRKIKQKASGLKTVKLPGPVKYSDLPDFINRMDFGVVPSIFAEPFGLVNLEYMACAKPVIASDVGGIPEVFNDREHGLLVRPNDPSALAKAIEYMLDHPEDREKMGRNARAHVVERFTWDRHVENLMGILTDGEKDFNGQ